MKPNFRLIVRETGENRLKIKEISQDRQYLEDKADKLSNTHPDWQVFVVRENYNVS